MSTEMACVYAALILADDDVAVTPDKISAILKAAGVDFEPYWPGLFAKVSDLISLLFIVFLNKKPDSMKHYTNIKIFTNFKYLKF